MKTHTPSRWLACRLWTWRRRRPGTSRGSQAARLLYLRDRGADLDPYLKEYLPKVKASVKAFGGKSLAGGDKIIAIEGDPPKHRIALVMFDSLDQLIAWRNSPNTRKTARSATNTRRSKPEGVTD